jgi:hypothetical protein
MSTPCITTANITLFVVPFTFRFDILHFAYFATRHMRNSADCSTHTKNLRVWDKQLRMSFESKSEREKFLHISRRFFRFLRADCYRSEAHIDVYINVIEILINPKVMSWFSLNLSQAESLKKEKRGEKVKVGF